ncbi:MAG TPA: hypothetical protein VEI50_04770 [Nitrospiraceae bacterium]|nr:hypothetical protein [Nitrospiraceae bacterium]
MKLGSKHTLIVRLIARPSALCGILGFTSFPWSSSAELAGVQWFASGTLLLVLALYMLADAAAATRKATKKENHKKSASAAAML